MRAAPPPCNSRAVHKCGVPFSQSNRVQAWKIVVDNSRKIDTESHKQLEIVHVQEFCRPYFITVLTAVILCWNRGQDHWDHCVRVCGTGLPAEINCVQTKTMDPTLLPHTQIHKYVCPSTYIVKRWEVKWGNAVHGNTFGSREKLTCVMCLCPHLCASMVYMGSTITELSKSLPGYQMHSPVSSHTTALAIHWFTTAHPQSVSGLREFSNCWIDPAAHILGVLQQPCVSSSAAKKWILHWWIRFRIKRAWALSKLGTKQTVITGSLNIFSVHWLDKRRVGQGWRVLFCTFSMHIKTSSTSAVR